MKRRVERSLLHAQLPLYNRTPGGQEVVVYIRLDERERSPGLAVEHQPDPSVDGVRWFGPYLGGARVRAAVTALQRAFPLQYTTISAVGSDRAFAQRLGVSAGDREDLAAAITAILDRDPEAIASIRSLLERERDRVSASQKYELADRAQRELESLAWVTSPQRLAHTEPADLDLHGWADGILVMLTIRSGRVTGWSQQPAGHTDAQTLLDATPDHWRAFTDRNAQLAAKLTAD